MYDLIWDPKALGHFFRGKISLPVARASLLLVSSSGFPLPSQPRLIRIAGSFDDVPAQASNTNYHAANDKYEGRKSSNDRFINLL